MINEKRERRAMNMDNNVFPTKGNLIASKNSYELSKLGFELLDKKRVILVNELMSRIDEAQKLREEVDFLFKGAYEALKRANIVMGSARIQSFALSTPLEEKIELDSQSVMGVEIPVIKWEKPEELQPNYGILNTDNSLDEAYCSFWKIKEKLIRLCELEVSVYKLANAVKKTSKRANALKNIMIPKYSGYVKCISDVLDEKEREEFSRLKILKSE